jgi:uncharacterized membrane protein
VGGRFYCAAHAAAAQPVAGAAPTTVPAAPPPAASVGADDVKQENPALAALCYILPAVISLPGLVLPVVVLVTEMKRSRTMRFHAFQSIFLAVAYLVVLAVASILTRAIHHLPLLGALISGAIWFVVGAGWLVLNIVLAVNAYNKKVLQLPVITQMASDQADRMTV